MDFQRKPRKGVPSKSALLGVLGSVMALNAPNVLAVEATGAVGVRLEPTDNVRQSTFYPENDVIQRVYGELGIEEVRKRFKADARISLENEHYYEGTYDDETSLTTGFGLFTIDLVEDFLEWRATFSRTDVLEDSSQDENPDTREYRNIFRTGPTINYAITRTTRFNLNGSYVKVDNSDATATDSERGEGSARLSHQLNKLTSFNLGGNYSEVIESDDDEEIKNSRVTVGFTRAYTDGSLTADFGRQEVRSNLAPTEDGRYIDIRATRASLLAHSWSLSFNQSISDTSIGFEDDETGNVLETDPIQSASQTDIETRDRVNLSVMRDADSFTYDIGLIYQESDQKVQDYVERYRGFTIGFSPKLYSRLIPRAEYAYSRESFGINRMPYLGSDTTHIYTFSLKYQLVQDLYADGFLKYEARVNNTAPLREYDEVSAGLGLRWEFL